ncbi:efflux RND transporter periplasmic adaptor subunit [Hansschlegelia zhihuaiae]|uniref:Efflux RND transporter periplasmic adaptor subunit n=1 Tax=Hansschlegelia zhihuaiae TaxID=405005 RepID=A0A4Q0MI64_9HYPH|nr:efflux RND transporter periplasmic adaptor subunit [Hansschlegelia zhihuaiae]RXF73311.1 efflux RND transporter periplasmic adaptor subunit [Hansschlegelia zhihuaiae]
MTTFVRSRKILLGASAGAALAAAALFVPFPSSDVSAVGADAAPAAVKVSVAKVEPRDVTRWAEFSGRLEAVDRVEVRSRVAGEIKTVHFREGALVKAGAPLFTIDPAPYEAALDRARAEVAAAEARVSLAASDLERGRRMTASETISRRDLDARTSGLREAEAAVQAARAAEKSATLDLGYTEVRAPVSGRVGRIEVTVGNLIAAGPGAPVLARLVSVDPVYASFDADEAAVMRALDTLPQAADRSDAVSALPVEMALASARESVRGKIQYVDPSVDPSAGTIKVRAVFPNPDGRLMPGQFARLKLGEAKPAPALLVGERAVGSDQDKSYVLVVGPDDKTAYREVRLGASVEGLRTVVEGLAAGERVVVNGLQKVKPGDQIAPEPVAMDGRPLTERQASAAQ